MCLDTLGTIVWSSTVQDQPNVVDKASVWVPGCVSVTMAGLVTSATRPRAMTSMTAMDAGSVLHRMSKSFIHDRYKYTIHC